MSNWKRAAAVGHSYGLTTIKLLFGQARHCAYPDCQEPLVFVDRERGVRSIAVQIAHIRSEKSNGPRFDPSYPAELVNSEENLLLLCGKHHTPVDQNESVFTTSELLNWKTAQTSQAGGSEVTEDDLRTLVTTLEPALAALVAALGVEVVVEVAGGRPSNGGVIAMPLGALRAVTMPEGTNLTRLLGVKVVNRGAASVDVAAAGIQFRFEGMTHAPATWIFEGRWCPVGFPHRLAGRSTQYWFMDVDVVGATMAEMARTARDVPSSFRVFAELGDESSEAGPWQDITELPIWKRTVTADSLRELARRARAGDSSAPL